MRVLHHLWLSAPCRKVRAALAEKKLAFEMRIEPIWERRESFLVLNPAGEVPVLVEDDGGAIAGHRAIVEYLEETQPEPPLIAGDARARAEVRRLTDWFDHKFAAEVTANLVGEKVMKRFLGTGEPSSSAIRAGLANIRTHLDYIGFLVDRRSWLAGPVFGLADLAAAAHLSTVDYLGDVPWDDFPSAREWYARVKSRPAFRPILADRIPGLPPPPHYADLDF